MRNGAIGCAILLAVIEGVGIGFQRMMAEQTRLEPPPMPQSVDAGKAVAWGFCTLVVWIWVFWEAILTSTEALNSFLRMYICMHRYGARRKEDWNHCRRRYSIVLLVLLILLRRSIYRGCLYRHTVSASIQNLDSAFYTNSPVHKSQEALRVLCITPSEKTQFCRLY